MFQRFYYFFHYCLLSFRYVMFQKRILSKAKWGGAQAVAKRGHDPPCPPPPLAKAQGWGFAFRLPSTGSWSPFPQTLVTAPLLQISG